MSGWAATAPIGLIQSASVSIGSGGTVALILAAANVKGVRLISLTISSGATSVGGGGLAVSFLVEDTVTDSASIQYGAVEIGMGSASNGQAVNSATFDLAGIVLAAGQSLSLNNGGAAGTGALRRCSATVIYSILV
jgi:hypothetical protein